MSVKVEDRPAVTLEMGADGVNRLETEPTDLAVPETRIETIIRLESKVEGDRWQLAELYAEQAEEATEREIADWVGKSQPHVHRMIVVGRTYQDETVERPDFEDAYRKAREPKNPRPVDTRRVSEALGKALVARAERFADVDPSDIPPEYLEQAASILESVAANFRAEAGEEAAA